MKLPLVDEIREARRLAEEAHQAAMQLHRIESALTSIDVMEQQVRLRPTLEAPIPAQETVNELAERWPQLSDLASHGGRAGEPLLHQLAARRAQLELALQVLRPLAQEAHERAQRLHALQHEQRHLLEDARYTDDVVELSDLGLERDRLALELTPLNSRLTLIEPACGMLDSFVDRLSRQAIQGDEGDPHGIYAWRAVHLARTFVESFHTVLQHLELEIPVPEPPEIPLAPNADEEAIAGCWAEVERVRQVLTELRGILTREGEALRRERDTRQLRHEELTRLILERMG